ncbi:hypothetical protein GCM10010988_07930 [Cnuibacter physcomitrellae]|uniref:Uncharacterized protein n=1 Tax=Cnuibacter physcomitrellae TaxID=1619308 RepID=A0A1X9LKD8_9MICO|nr:hypothetical protein [Cnuibacter physcomitrellae]ARJ05676.1 hypothetical protein B5808_10915 [Cnuibacter physcomitrellae]GGI36234.1 hypothetical protein GCM10010988_07930 [Cnuibacter physcomitrellae]
MSELSPLPGDPDRILGDGTRYREAAEAIARAAQQLRALSGDGFRSQAVDAIVETAAEAAESVTKAHTRYAEAAEALIEYAGPMRDAHDRAESVIAANPQTVDQLAWLQPQLDDARRTAETPGPDQAPAVALVTQLQAQVDQLHVQLAQAQEAWNAARDDMNRAAAVAAARIHRGNEADDLNDSFWDSLGDLFDIGRIIADIVSVILKIVSVILTVLSVVFAALSVVMPAFAAIAGMLFLYAKLVNVAIAILALLQFAMNGFHLLDLALAGLAVVAAYGGAALGSALGSAAKAAAAGASSVAGSTVSTALGELAQQAVSQAAGGLTDQVVDGILDLGGPGARGLYDSISGIGHDALQSAFGDDVTSFSNTVEGLGAKVGSDLAEGVEASGLGSVVRTASSAAGQVAAQAGLVTDAVYGVGSSVVDTVRNAFDSAQSSLDDAARSTFGSLFDGAMKDVATQIHHDLGSSVGGPDVGAKLGDAITGRLSDAIGGLPGGDAVAHAVGDSLGGVAQSAYDASQRPAMTATPVGAR